MSRRGDVLLCQFAVVSWLRNSDLCVRIYDLIKKRIFWGSFK